MKYRQLGLVLLCNILPLLIGMGLFPLLPLYTAQLGATHALIGLYFAVVYVASAAGVMLSNWLAERLPRRAVFMAGGFVGASAMGLLGTATALWQATLLTAAVWLCGGITLTLLNVYTGLISDNASRGRLFSLMTLAYPLAAVVGGAIVGPLVAAGGFPLTFAVLGTLWVIQPIAGFFALRDPRFAGPAPRVPIAADHAPLGRGYLLLVLASLLSLLGISIGRLGTSLSMQSLAFAPGDLASTSTIGGLAAIPAVLLFGALSDRLGRRLCLLVSYAMAAGGAVTLALATQLWHFWLAATLLLVAWCASRSIAAALATDLLPVERLGRGLTRLNAMDSLASIVGFAGVGVALDVFGATGVYLGAAVLVVMAAQLLAPRLGRQARATQPQPVIPVAIPVGPSAAEFRPKRGG
jgi:MFS family permease